MPNNLKIFLLIICFLTYVIMYKMLKKKKIIFKHALFWSFLNTILVLCVIFVDYLRNIADFIGIEKISNMIFLFGFIVLIAICIALTSIVSEQKNKIIVLTQEMGILKNKVKEIENEKTNKKQ